MSILVFKQWLYQPNLKSTPVAVDGMLNYIATREGVIPNEDQELHDESRYVDYIATRPGVAKTAGQSGGLFGRLQGMKSTGNLNDLTAVRTHVRKLAADSTTIFNAIISLDEADAIPKGFGQRSAWEQFVSEQMPTIARSMGIPLSSLEWCAACHMEQGHPHVHLMYWDKNQKIGRNFIQPELSNDIRKKLTRVMFRDELKAVYSRKDDAQREVLAGSGQVLKSAQNALNGMTPRQVLDNLPQKTALQRLINHRLAARQAEPAAKELIYLTAILAREYQKGAYKYAYLSPELKQQVDRVVKKIIALHPEVQSAYEDYCKAAQDQAAFFGEEDAKGTKELLQKSRQRLYTNMGNQVLKICKELLPAVREADRLEAHSQYVLNQGMLLFQRLCNHITDETEQVRSFGKSAGKFSQLSQIEREEILRKMRL